MGLGSISPQGAPVQQLAQAQPQPQGQPINRAQTQSESIQSAIKKTVQKYYNQKKYQQYKKTNNKHNKQIILYYNALNR